MGFWKRRSEPPAVASTDQTFVEEFGALVEQRLRATRDAADDADDSRTWRTAPADGRLLTISMLGLGLHLAWMPASAAEWLDSDDDEEVPYARDANGALLAARFHSLNGPLEPVGESHGAIVEACAPAVARLDPARVRLIDVNEDGVDTMLDEALHELGAAGVMQVVSDVLVVTRDMFDASQGEIARQVAMTDRT
jgi:hypothetical protein